jgi:hypothetical protein
MRVATAGIGLLLFTTAAYAQPRPCAPQTLAYDPYNPSDLAIVRNYGGTVLAQAPLSALLELDPYVPSDGELLRQLGRAIPLWPAYPWPAYAPAPAYPPAPTLPDCPPVRESSSETAAPLTRFADVVSALQHAPASPATADRAPSVRPTETAIRNSVWIQYAGRTWISAGAAVPFRDAEFERIGERAGFPVFRQTGTSDDFIFVPTTTGMVAPFRASPRAR